MAILPLCPGRNSFAYQLAELEQQLCSRWAHLFLWVGSVLHHRAEKILYAWDCWGVKNRFGNVILWLIKLGQEHNNSIFLLANASSSQVSLHFLSYVWKMNASGTMCAAWVEMCFVAFCTYTERKYLSPDVLELCSSQCYRKKKMDWELGDHSDSDLKRVFLNTKVGACVKWP